MLPTLDNSFHPQRVMVGVDYAVTFRRSEEEFRVHWDVVFLRTDGWTLASPEGLIGEAYHTWPDVWTHFARRGDASWRPIQEYEGYEQ